MLGRRGTAKAKMGIRVGLSGEQTAFEEHNN